MLSCRPSQRVAKRGALDAHEARLADEIDAGLAQRRVDGIVEGLARGEALVVDGQRLEAGGARALAGPAPPAGWRRRAAISAG